MSGLACAGIAACSWALLAYTERRTQVQTDPSVCTVWVLGMTEGHEQVLHRSSPIQDWLADHGIHFPGAIGTLSGQFHGDPDGAEVWFDYRSLLPQHPMLECHRIGDTAFLDDLGQAYQGYLDFQGHCVGVYLPGYDHAAHRLTCALHWMPRQPAPPYPMSRPMVFTFDLPRARRILPEAAALPANPLPASAGGVSVTLSEVRLSRAEIEQLTQGQRQLTFRLKVTGGAISDANVLDLTGDLEMSQLTQTPSASTLATLNRDIARMRRGAARLAARSAPRMTITDPYGVPLLSNDAMASRMVSSNGGAIRDGSGAVWAVPVNGAGKGTDVVRIQLDISPSGGGPDIHFDLLAPVASEQEA